MKLDMTPWAKASLSLADYAYIQEHAPEGATVSIGKGRGWCCRILIDGRLVGEVFHCGTPMAAFRACLADVVAKEAARA